MLSQLNLRLKEHANPEKAKHLQRFFKTGPGEYGEGDVFLGLVMGKNRALVKEFRYMGFDDIQKLLDTDIHEKRMIGVLILVNKFQRASKKGYTNGMNEIFDFYLKNAHRVNNWDLVDLSAPQVVGGYLLDKKWKRKVLYELVKSDNLWERRISVLGTFAFIRDNDFDDALQISELLLDDSHDLIHKAVGWMLREVGKRDVNILEEFLKKHYIKMPRTMLRYSIEKFDGETRKKYLKGEIDKV
jgi:3-methyladenine DNA glycosylase AlkD